MGIIFNDDDGLRYKPSRITLTHGNLNEYLKQYIDCCAVTYIPDKNFNFPRTYTERELMIVKGVHKLYCHSCLDEITFNIIKGIYFPRFPFLRGKKIGFVSY